MFVIWRRASIYSVFLQGCHNPSAMHAHASTMASSRRRANTTNIVQPAEFLQSELRLRHSLCSSLDWPPSQDLSKDLDIAISRKLNILNSFSGLSRTIGQLHRSRRIVRLLTHTVQTAQPLPRAREKPTLIYSDKGPGRWELNVCVVIFVGSKVDL